MGKRRAGKEKSVGKDQEKDSEASKRTKRMTNLYREFSRRKYNKYKHQFPRLKESELIQKVIAEWEKLTEEEKKDLDEEYYELGSLSLEKKSKPKSKSQSKSKSKSKSKSGSSKNKSSKSKKDSKSKSKEEEAGDIVGKKKKKSSPKVRKFEEKRSVDKHSKGEGDFRKEPGDVMEGQSSSGEYDIAVAGGRKTKRITKSQGLFKKQSEYVQFYRHYYNSLASEHPRWSPDQVKTIIKLLWKKKKAAKSKKGNLITRRKKFVSGRIAYRQEKQRAGLGMPEIKMYWRKLPIESKRYWQKMGRGFVPKVKQDPRKSMQKIRSMMRSGGQQKLEENEFSWMQKNM